MNENLIGSGIYCYENKVNSKKYIGQSIDLNKRIKDHERNFKKEDFKRTNGGENKPLWYAIKKYGRENFLLYILEKVDREFLDDREEYYINLYHSLADENGYNILKRGFNRFGTKHSNETKVKFSLIHSNISEETRKRMSNSQKGRHHSEETKLKISKGNVGKIISQETISKAKRTGIFHFMFGKKHKEETKEKMREKSVGENNSQFGKKYSESSSVYYGVSYNKRENKWKSSVNMNKKRIHLGYYKVEFDSAIASDFGLIYYYGADCNLNFPENREEYISYLNQYEILDIKELRKVIKNYIIGRIENDRR